MIRDKKQKNPNGVENSTIIKVSCVVAITLITSIILLFFYSNNVAKQASYAVWEEENKIETVTIEDNDIFNITLENIVQENASKIVREEIVTQETDLEYMTKYIDNPELPKNTIQVVQEGVTGRQQVILKKTYEGDLLIKEEEVGNKEIKGSINKIVEIGTSNSKISYNVREGDTLYVISDIAPIKIEPNKDSQTLITINKGDAVTLTKIGENWYKVKYQNYQGWVDANMVSHINTNGELIEEMEEGQAVTPKTQLISGLSESIALNKPSGLSLTQFRKVLSNNQQDENNVFVDNAQYFYYVEKQYNVNGIFVAAVGIHESNWGTSAISLRKKNLFGYGAYDRAPGENAYSFDSYAEGIDLIARVFAKYYVNPKGTKIYNGETAEGSHYHGSTLRGVNVKYATDPNWNQGVYKWMSYLYNRL